jgi:signal transduction histidine kinase/DNA-binding response OmpR family regulator
MAALLQRFLEEMGYALLEQTGQGRFQMLAHPPVWFTEVWGESLAGAEEFSLAADSPFLENFLVEAEAFWNSREAGECRSDIWFEKTGVGKEIPLQAMALRLEGKQVLALHQPAGDFQEQSRVLQTARNSALEHERLVREIQKKEILLHCIIHDLSQPLSAMRGSFDCLSGEQASARAQQFVEIGKLASDQQESMIREILHAFSADLQSTLEAGQEASDSPNLLQCAQTALQTLSPAFEAKRVKLSLDPRIDVAAGWRVNGEETRLRRIFTNLLENALRYTPPGARVTVGVEDDVDFCKAYVDDEGPGLPEDLRPVQIFSMFSKGKSEGGKAGLGLYFCRIMVERWGGAIGCASLPEKGARFWFRLPKAEREAKSAEGEKELAPRVSAASAPCAAQRTLRILFADDQADIRNLTTYQLERGGHSILAVPDGKEALRATQREAFDLILLDEEMPGMRGDHVARVIREHETKSGGHAFLVALTGNDSKEDRARLQGVGFDAVLAKPFHLEALADVLLNSKRRVTDVPVLEKPNLLVQPPTSSPLERVGGDEKLLRKMTQTFLRDTPRRLAAMERAIQQKNGEQLASLAHALKGSVSIFGAPEARQRAQNLQRIGRGGELGEAAHALECLKEEIAKLEENLRGYARQPRARAKPDGAKEQGSRGKRGKTK